MYGIGKSAAIGTRSPAAIIEKYVFVHDNYFFDIFFRPTSNFLFSQHKER
jgi:hypothetical protein